VIRSLVAISLSLLVSVASADETITTTPTLPDGGTANAPISNKEGVKNWTSRGLGCCVIASQKANANYLDMPEVGETLKQLSLQEAGGHEPGKLERVFREAKIRHPSFQWEQWWNQPDGWERAKAWSAQGVPLGVTWGTGQRYGYMPIAHMVSATHISDEWVQVKDNNFPEEYSTVPGPEGRRRIAMGGLEWYVALIPPDGFIPHDVIYFLVVGGALGFYGLIVLIGVFVYASKS